MGNLKIKKFYNRILVSNSPISQANGIYTLSSVRVNGLRYYEQESGNWRIAAGKDSILSPFNWAIYVDGVSVFFYSINSSFNSIFDLPQYPWECSGWIDQNQSPVNIKLEPYSTLTKNSISIKPQNLTVSNYSIALVNGIYKLQNTLINGRNWYLHSTLLFNIRWNNSINRWQLLSFQGQDLSTSTNSANNPWEATWSQEAIQVSLGSGGRLVIRNLLKTLSNQIDPIIENLTANDSTLKLFSTEQPNGICCQGVNSTNPVNPVYIRNTSCWAKDIDTSPISIWNNGGGYPEPEHAGGTGGTGILITRKHIILAAHFRMKIGSKLIFVDMNNNTYVRTLVNVQQILSDVFDPWLQQFTATDILIGVLDSDLPNSVSNIKILDPNIANKLKIELTTKRIPVFLMNAERKAFVGELISTGSSLQISNNPTNPSKRREFYPFNSNFGYALNFGDSANTCSIIYNNKLVHVFHFMFPNLGPEAYPYINKINQAINSLGNPNNYTIEIESLNI